MSHARTTSTGQPVANGMHYVVVAALLVLTFWFYVWTAGQGLGFSFAAPQSDYYNDLTNGIAAGQLSLLTRPAPELLALDDPYDPGRNAPYRMHDASLYKGKYFLYFGITPVVLLFLPFRLLGLGQIPQGASVVCFAFGGLLWSLLTMVTVRQTLFPERSLRVPLASLVMIGFGSAIPFLLRRPASYEVAISCGFFCVAAAVYCLVSATLGESASAWRLGLGSLFLGLAVGARPNLMLAAPLMALPIWRARRDGDPFFRREPGRAAALLLPFVTVIFLLGLYNYLRFDSWTEFGNNYQLAGVDVRHLRLKLTRVSIFSYLYLWHACDVNFTFPYTHVSFRSLAVDASTGMFNGQLTRIGSILAAGLPANSSGVEAVAGVFFTTPILYVLALAPFLGGLALMRRIRGRAHEPDSTIVALALVLGALGALQLLFVCVLPGATMRYVVDFAPLLMTATGIVMLCAERELWDWPLMRAAGAMAIVLLLALTVFFNLGLSITGYDTNIFKAANPAGFDSVRRTFDGVARRLAPWLGGRVPGVVASGYYAGKDEFRPENAFDGNEQTVWAADGSAPARLLVTPERAGALTSIRLVEQPGPKVESWQRVDVRLLLKGREVSRQALSLPVPVGGRQEVEVQPVHADAIELDFSEPVTRTPAGELVEHGAVHPGYAEIAFTWGGARVTASSYYGRMDGYKVENAFDGDEGSVWVAQGSGPATVEITPLSAGTLESISLLGRRTSLMEVWKRLDVEMFRSGVMVSRQSFFFENAATGLLQLARLDAVETDRVELHFSEPVTTTLMGGSVDAAAVNPGYAEIITRWKE